jgi:hypothetical protein
MEILAEPNNVVPNQNPGGPELAYVLSSMYGFGHSARAIAVAHALNPVQPITFIAKGAPSHKFLKNNLTGYESRLSFVEPDAERPMTDEEFELENQHLVEIFARAGAIVNDFNHQIPGLRSLMAQSGVEAPLVGIYHSVSGYSSVDETITRLQKNFMQGAQGFDYLFLMEPKTRHEPSYALESGTQVVPIDPIVRRPDLTAEEVKIQLGLDPDDEFVYVQGGGQINGEELEVVGRWLHSSSLRGLRAVVAFNGTLQSVSAGTTTYIKPRSDGHNLIAASVGVISKPGMGTISEAIANRKPLLLVDYPGAEAQSKFEIIKHILGDDVPFRLDVARHIGPQITRWLEAGSEISSRLSTVPCEGASLVAHALRDMQQFESSAV